MSFPQMHLNCDFCYAPKPTRAYQCRDFESKAMMGNGSTGGWAACRTCARMIDAKQYRKLAAHAANSFFRRNPEFSQHLVYTAVREQMYALFLEFQAHRIEPN
jgi:hypothetical protein